MPSTYMYSVVSYSTREKRFVYVLLWAIKKHIVTVYSCKYLVKQVRIKLIKIFILLILKNMW